MPKTNPDASADLEGKDKRSQIQTVQGEEKTEMPDSLLSGMEKKWNPFLAKERENLGERVNVTLDPDTAHPQLVLSEDGKSVRWKDIWQDLPDNPERFDSWACVLGCEGFTSGRHCWEVEVGGWGVYVVGVARESVGRKGEISFSPEEGIWSVGQAGGQYWALTSPKKVILPLSCIPQRIWVSLDYEEGLVTFFDADNESLIFPYQRASFTGERVLPFFVCEESVQLTLPPSEMRV
ncbi:butyrophilin subfamily 1 member A1-like [Malaclemys terrapin pileata]|uniref:butyrophilin subfamily 1 member A1-like n=1 Tax=Malaclemys terrapin pileata TaxID=2991368 RepID=UPI0023A7C85F|nr:butyrophilin subfamily 1 member A1-like [Malaclemys terrapin pileata]